MAEAAQTAPVSPEAFRGNGAYTQWGDPKVFVLDSVATTNTFTTGLLGIERWAIYNSDKAVMASLDATTGIFTFTVTTGPAAFELLVWGPDVYAIASGGTA